MVLNGLFCADVPLKNYSLTHSRLPLNSMTLNDLERQNRGFNRFFFGDFRLRDTFQEGIAPKPIKIDMDRLRMKFSVLNSDLNGPSLDFLGLRKPVSEGIRLWYPCNSRDKMAGDRLTVCEQELL